jgi:putative SOS response-associated peptidase YedK
MCVQYHALKSAQDYQRFFGVDQPANPGKQDLWPGYEGSFIRRPSRDGDDSGADLDREVRAGLFGLVPHWATHTRMARNNYNARSETVDEKPSYRDAWAAGQRCIIPAQAIFEPDWRSGRAVSTRIARADGQPMGIAGIWSCWQSPQGAAVFSYSMLTIIADQHPLMRNFHRPEDEKRMVVVLPEDRYADWLQASVLESSDFLLPYPAEALQATAPPQPQASLFG